MENQALITNDGMAFGVIMLVLGLIFYTSSKQSGFWEKFYRHIPALLLCYFLPGLLTTTNVVSAESGDKIYYIASRYLLPASLVLLTLSVDLKKIIGLGWKALAMFFTATIGIMLGGPFAIWLFHVIAPEWVAGDIWKGLSTLAGSWIGGGANMASMKELHHVNDTLFGTMAVVDVIVAEFWMITLLFLAKNSKGIDHWLKADTRAVDDLKHTIERYQKENARIPSLNDLMIILAIAFFIVGLGHLAGAHLGGYFKQFSWAQEYSLSSAFLWLVVVATIGGIGLSFTPLRHYENAGASKVGTVFIYILVAAIGMHMDLTKILSHWHLVLVGLVWVLFHIVLLVIMAKLIRAPLFFLAVGSKANIGGAASAPVIAAAFHPSLAPVGVLLAILGYAIGTIGAYLTGEMMRLIVGG
ncbi:DUF819 domain-containing protein [Suttonella ornithocola]|uniref:Predicted integral membrane protein n=1 Tax=Suttonella ornithocola TaxID=279832 RepID=A0A380N0J5_9GAMM|nr:DUF819 family protein [Suttonella ornithocola]SUO97441.1 Predicted integral membrane protein [Suttonella ornithocola]